MRKSGPKRDHVWSDKVDFSGMAAWLRQKFPHKTAQSVADATGLPPDSVKKWINLETQPSGGAVFVLWRVFGEEFMRSAFADWWVDDARARKIEKLKLELAALERR